MARGVDLWPTPQPRKEKNVSEELKPEVAVKAPKKPVKKPAAKVDFSAKIKELEAKLAAQEAKLAAGEEAALARVCKAMDLEPSEVKSKEDAKPVKEDMVRCFVHYPVRINSNVYVGHVTVPYSTFRVIQQALGDRRQRLLRELTGSNYILRELETGGYAPHKVGEVGMEGERTG